MAMPAASMLAGGRATSADRTSSPPAPSRTHERPGAPTSPRSSFLGSFMRGRTRAASVTNSITGAVRGRVASPTVEAPNPLDPVARTVSSPATPQTVDLPPIDPALRRTHRIRLVPVLETNRSFSFEPVQRELGVMHVPPGIVPSVAAASVSTPGPLVNGRAPPLLMKIGRFTDRVQQAAVAEAQAAAAAVNATPLGEGASSEVAGAAGTNVLAPAAAAAAAAAHVPIVGGGGGDLLSPRAAFRSKVVSRSHAEIWCEPGGKFYIRDTASSSGTFLNHIRLSSPNVQSRPQLLKDGDVLQLGVDYQGGAEEMYRCVKMRVEVGREWQQRGASEFNKKAIKQLTALRGETEKQGSTSQAGPSVVPKGRAVTDCCICLFSVAPAQSLFIAPCSHVYHYKCIRPLLMQHHPGFSCPLCRTYANLDEDVEIEDAWDAASRRHSVRSRRNSTSSQRPEPVEEGDVLSELSINGVLASAESDDPIDASSSHASMDGTPAMSGTGTPAEVDEHTPSRATATPMAIGERPTLSRQDTSVSASLAQTPMNDIFLSTLVLSPNTPTSSQTHTHETPGGSIADASLRVTPEIPEEPAAEERSARTSADARRTAEIN
ncbi:hypothetical protein CC85DRAFT_301411 [Cutaneotrichosporon oleaginosum]|uniref:SMAD/FHA domain-containing protein n=1 Tax=Cutaneotrichosporon oleaginosum TaxID=879819 RepID=A0A0J0XQQ0_9TREE|nr:uncharacterized protein CC85DRAFT_301411 [Cutaneotrichosporon oleaginosum]KLT43405.1 hypothetical protein CC85DRAFT_301411 [Cutaneotrichosporon oleaginosum]TXT05381.1 hypothetical protein COLE_06701 [Cutaneotrichosporon oleaginosum]